MLTFILGAFFGAFAVYAARLADTKVTPLVERYKTTGSLVPRRPIVIDGTDKVQEFIDENFETVKE
jgi:hypothetical protein